MSTSLRRTLQDVAALNARTFNVLYPVGTRIRFWPGERKGPGITSRTRSTAWASCGASLVSVEGYAGGISLSHIEVIRL